MIKLIEHSARRPLIDELHARPFTPLQAPVRIMHLAFMPEIGEAQPDSAAKIAHLEELLVHLGAPKPPTELRSHFVASVDGFMVKWERHTEFVSVSLIDLDPDDRPIFTPTQYDRLPEGWLDRAPGHVISASLMEIRQSASRAESERALSDVFDPLFVRSSFAASFVAEGLALATTDFQRDDNGFVRMGVLVEDELGPRRTGRVAQRFLELEVYRSMAMLALPTSRRLAPELSEIDQSLDQLAKDALTDGSLKSERQTLEALTMIAAQLESMAASTAYRLDASRAYNAILDERLDLLGNGRALARQTLREFMVRRYRPAMRSCWATAERLSALSTRAERAANLLRTRVDVALEEQNQNLLESMDRRAKLQLRLQETVEGLSVVAISYYAVSLAGYVLAPLAKSIGFSATLLKGAVALPIILLVWWMVRQIRKNVEKNSDQE